MVEPDDRFGKAAAARRSLDARSRAVRSLSLLALFALALGGAWAFARHAPVLVDTDSYYHLAVGRVLRTQGWPESFPWARFSLLGPPGGFPDKEPLFHLLLAPFTGASPATSGGRLALALFAAAIATMLAAVARRWLGWAGLLVPFAVVLLALDVPDRLMRLRPELLSLLVLLVATDLAARERDRAVGLCGFVYALSYTAFHLFLALVALWFLWSGARARRWRWALPLYAGLGTGLGLLVHPAFPRNLQLWAVVNVRLFDFVGALGAGGEELRPGSTAELLAKNLGWWLAAALLVWARGRFAGTGEGTPRSGPDPAPWAIGAVVFGLLYLAMWRFGLYFFPFATLALCGLLAPRDGRGLFASADRPRRLRTAIGLALIGCLLVSAPRAWAMGRYFLDESAPGPPREVEWRAFGEALPEGARVAAPWGQAQAYLWYAPQARYLNFLDPVLMALPFAREFALQRELFEGREPDLAPALVLGLDSEWLAFSRFAAPSVLWARAEGDPRLERTYTGYNLLYRAREGANGAFRLDWKVAPVGVERAAAVRYPRLEAKQAAALEGFVDAARVGLAGRCALFSSRERRLESGPFVLELAAYGPASLSVDGRPRLELRGSSAAVLGEGPRLALELDAGDHELVVTSCPDPATGRNGFFLLER